MSTRSAELQELYDRGYSSWTKAKLKPVVGAYVLPEFENTAWYALIYETARRFEVNRLASGLTVSDTSNDYEKAMKKVHFLLPFLPCPFEVEVEDLQSELEEAPLEVPISWTKNAAIDRATKKVRLDALSAEIDTDNEFRIARADLASYLIDVETSELVWLVDSKIAPAEVIEAIDLQRRRVLETEHRHEEKIAQQAAARAATFWQILSIVLLVAIIGQAIHYFNNSDLTIVPGKRRISLLERAARALSQPSRLGFSPSDDIRMWLLILTWFGCSIRYAQLEDRAHPGRRTNT